MIEGRGIFTEQRGGIKKLLLFVMAGLAILLIGVLFSVVYTSMEMGGASLQGVIKREVSKDMAAAPAAEAPAAVVSEAAGTHAKVMPDVMPIPPMVGSTTNRQVIKNADLELGVTNLDDSMNEATRIATSAGGVVTESWVSQNTNTPPPIVPQKPVWGGISSPEKMVSEVPREGRLVLRIPSDKFDVVMPQLRKIGQVEGERLYTQDVTTEYVDLQARVTNLEEQERRVRALLSTAKTIDDVLRVESELARIRTEIDSHKGRLRYLADQITYSTINLNLRETVKAARKVEAPAWQGVWERSAKAFVVMTNMLVVAAVNLVVFMAGMIPVLVAVLIVGAVVLMVLRIVRRRQPPRTPGV